MRFIQDNSDENLIFNISLARMTFLSCKEKNFLSKKLDSSRSLALLSMEEIFSFLGRPVPARALWDGRKNLEAAEKAARRCELMGISVIHNGQREYPQMLRNIDNPPFVLYCRGNAGALNQKCVSVVGTRRLTANGRRAAHDFAYGAARSGCTVVSGLAYGADSCAHKGAVDAFFDALADGDSDSLGKTIAVLPSGIDEIVPAANKPLAEKILKSGGCIVSEYEPGMPVANWHFIARNRIVAGLSPAVVVIEAPAGSGALITADLALESGRDVFFHESSVSQQAQEVSAVIKRSLDARFARKEVSRYKIENCVEKYLESGAALIRDYDDYCKALAEMPGERGISVIQEDLF